MVSAIYELSQRHQAPKIADLEERFGHRLKPSWCFSKSDCEYEVHVSNRVLSSLRLVPYSQIKTSFWIRDGVLVASMTDFTINRRRESSVVSHTQIDFCDTCQYLYIHPWDDSSGLDTNGSVQVGYKTPAKNRHTVLSLDTTCLTRLGGCDTVADLVPTVWKVEGDRIVCTVSNEKGIAEEPAGLR